MHKRSVVGLLALLVLAAGCKSQSTSAQRPAEKAATMAQVESRPADKAGAPHAAPVDIGDFDVVKLDFRFGPRAPKAGAGKPGPAAKTDAPGGARAPGGGPQGRRGGVGGMIGHGGSCPQTELAGLLGVVFAQPHGCIVRAVRKDSPIAKAGLRAGDSIVACNGSAVTCPSTLLPALFANGGPGAVTLTIHRPKHWPGAKKQGKQPASKSDEK